MQTIADVMTHDVISITPNETVQRAARLMDELNVGVLPVCDGSRLVGVITDRDIVVRVTASGLPADIVAVEEVMSAEVKWCLDDQRVDEVLAQMENWQIRRLPVCDHNTKALVGIVSLGDLSAKHSAGIDHALERISRPAGPNRPQLHS